MANDKDICLWLDYRWYNALEKHLKDETVEDKLNEFLDELINQLPEQEYERVSHEIADEEMKARAQREANRIYTAFRIHEFGETLLFRTEGETSFLSVGNALRNYLKSGERYGFAKGFRDQISISQDEYDQLVQMRFENTGKVAQTYDIDFDADEFAALHIMDGWKTYRIKDISSAAYYAMKKSSSSWDDRFAVFLSHLSGKELVSDSVVPITVRGTRVLEESDVYFGDEIIVQDNGDLNFYLNTFFDVDEVFGTNVCTGANDDWLNVYAEYDSAMAQVKEFLFITLCREDGSEEELRYHLSPNQREMLEKKMSAYCGMPVAAYAESMKQRIERKHNENANENEHLVSHDLQLGSMI